MLRYSQAFPTIPWSREMLAKLESLWSKSSKAISSKIWTPSGRTYNPSRL